MKQARRRESESRTASNLITEKQMALIRNPRIQGPRECQSRCKRLTQSRDCRRFSDELTGLLTVGHLGTIVLLSLSEPVVPIVCIPAIGSFCYRTLSRDAAPIR